MTTSNNGAAPLVQLEWDKAQALLENATNIAVISHINPDGDAIGSLLGMTIALRENGKQARPYLEGGPMKRFRFLPFHQDIRGTYEGPKPDLIISTDASDEERLGPLGAELMALDVPLIQLDHHQTNVLFGDALLVDARTAAACEGILDWLDQLGWKFSAKVAQCLLTGVVTDTLCFRTSNVTADTLDKANRLMRRGANLAVIVQRTMARQPTNLIRLYGKVLPRLQLENGVIWVTTTPEDYTDSGLDIGDFTGLSSYLIQAEEASVSAAFTVTNEGDIDCSFRAIPGFDVSQVALQLGGGGHVQASGCNLKGISLEDAVEKVIPLLKAAVRQGKLQYG